MSDSENLDIEARHQTPHKHRVHRDDYKRRPNLGIWTIVFLVIIVSIIASAKINAVGPEVRELKNKSSSMRFTVFGISRLPAGYFFRSPDITTASDTLFITLRTDDINQPTITISQQPVPDKIPVTSLLGLHPPGPVETKNGKLYITESRSTRNAILTTTDSWVLISAPKSFTADQLRSLAENLTPVSTL